MKNLNSIDSRWVVETTVKIWEISGGEADRDIQVFYPPGFL